MGIQLSDEEQNIVGKEEIAHFSNVFKSCLLLMRQKQYLCSIGLIEHDLQINYGLQII